VLKPMAQLSVDIELILAKERSMRVLGITNYSDRPEAETLIGLKRLGVDIHLFCPQDAAHCHRFAQAGIPMTDCRLKGRIDRRAIRRIRRHLLETGTEILHMFNSRAISNGILASRGIPVKNVVYRGVVGRVNYLDPGSLMTYLHPRVDRIICVSEAVRRHFLSLRFLWLRIPAFKLITIYKGHNLSWYQEKPVDLSSFGIPASAFVVGFTGRPDPNKGLHTLVDAMRFLPEGPPIHLLLIGNLNKAALLRRIVRNPRAARIHLAGYRTDAPALQAACNTVVLPTLWREGLPKVIIEAMAHGITPIVTDVGGNPELVEHDRSGIIVPPGRPEEIARAIMRLYEDPEGCRTMGGRARDRIHRCFHIDNTIQQTLDLYESCLNPATGQLRREPDSA
jgi:glycosyltransferase involved in cell wall biosynthesis